MVTYSIEEGVLTLKSEGDRTLADVRSVLARAMDDPELPRRVSLLLDVCKSEHVPTSAEIIAFAEFLKTAHGLLRGPCAVLACDVLRFGLGRQLSGWAAARGVQVRVFRLEEFGLAQEWLRTGAPEAAGSP